MIPIEEIKLATVNLNNTILSTPLNITDTYSNKYSSYIYLKREDLQVTRSFKIRGSFNKILSLSESEKQKGKRKSFDIQ